MTDYYAALSDARSAYQSEAQRGETLALQYAKLANDNYWNELNYRSDREDAANAQYWKQLAYADKQAAAAEKAQKASASGKKQTSSGLTGKSYGTKKQPNAGKLASRPALR